MHHRKPSQVQPPMPKRQNFIVETRELLKPLMNRFKIQAFVVK